MNQLRDFIERLRAKRRKKDETEMSACDVLTSLEAKVDEILFAYASEGDRRRAEALLTDNIVTQHARRTDRRRGLENAAALVGIGIGVDGVGARVDSRRSGGRIGKKRMIAGASALGASALSKLGNTKDRERKRSLKARNQEVKRLREGGSSRNGIVVHTAKGREDTPFVKRMRQEGAQVRVH